MKAKKNLIITILLLAIFLAVVQVTQVAGKSEPQIKATIEPRDILAGLQGVRVVVDEIEPDEEKFGFNRQQFQTDVELRLRQFGIKVLTLEERLLTLGTPYLYINVISIIPEGIPLAAVKVSVELKENVLLERNPTILTNAATWHTGGVATVGLDNISQIREVVIKFVDEFINDYLAANPKEQTPQQKTEK